jgi:hypothetical protein
MPTILNGANLEGVALCVYRRGYGVCTEAHMDTWKLENVSIKPLLCLIPLKPSLSLNLQRGVQLETSDPSAPAQPSAFTH